VVLTHGVDLDLWRRHVEPHPAIMRLERPIVVFWGLVDQRLDMAFLRQLAADLKTGTIALVGPRADAEPTLAFMPRVAGLPALPYEKLPALAAAADVLIMPYADLPVTRALQPLKLKEYLATDRPVVARDLPAVREWSDCLDSASTPAEFSALVRKRLVEGLPKGQARARLRLEKESWSAKAAQFEELLFNERDQASGGVNPRRAA
jgi:glycosyltransferase involved in cell wall biosynthesis